MRCCQNIKQEIVRKYNSLSQVVMVELEIHLMVAGSSLSVLLSEHGLKVDSGSMNYPVKI